MRQENIIVPERYMLPLIEKIYERDTDGAPVNRYHLPKKIENFHGGREIFAVGVQSTHLAKEKKAIRKMLRSKLGHRYKFDNVIHCTEEADWVWSMFDKLKNTLAHPHSSLTTAMLELTRHGVRHVVLRGQKLVANLPALSKTDS